MKCPYCSEEMKLGVIYGDKCSLKWISLEKDKGPLLQWFSKGIKLSDVFENNSIESFFCENCKKIIIDVEDKID